jgi:Holliday junction DNA helicase RuvA
MISTLQGTLLSKTPTELVIDVGGVGYGVQIPLSTFEATGDVGSTVKLHTHLHVREDVLQLYGFASVQERTVFRMLVSVSGVGPRMAQGILSGSSVSEFKSHITQGDFSALTAIPGVGKKMAERLIVELREKVERAESEPPIGTGA